MILRQYHVGNPVRVIADYSRNYLRYGAIEAVSGMANWYEVRFPDGSREYVHGGMIRIAEPAETTTELEGVAHEKNPRV